MTVPLGSEPNPSARGRSRSVVLSIRVQAAIWFVVVALLPATLVSAWLTQLYAAAVLTTERQLQTAVLDEVCAAAAAESDAVVGDLRAVGAVLSLAAGHSEPDASKLVRAVVSSREHLAVVRFEVPSAGVSTVIRRGAPRVEVPALSPDIRRRADERGVALGMAPSGALVVVVPIRGGVRGYVATVTKLPELTERLQTIAATRFDDPHVQLAVVTRDARAVATHGLGSIAMGEELRPFPPLHFIDAAGWERRVALVADYGSGNSAQVAAVQTVPRREWAVAVARPRWVAYRNLAALTPRFVVAALGALVFALVAGGLAARAVTRPVLRLAEQARHVGRREFGAVELDTERRDELGELNRAMSDMARDLEASEAEALREARLRGDLSRFMSPQVVEAIVSGQHEITLGGHRAEVTVLFADVVAFTPLAESRAAEEVVGLLNELFAMLSEVVFRHGGMVDKFIGDSIMGVWGAPFAQPDHAARALAAAEDMLRFLDSANEDWRERLGVEIRLAIGINSGDAIVGNIGSPKRMEYTVVGDTVNVAARLEALARPNQILVGARVNELVDRATTLRSLGEQRLTGREAPTEVFELVR